ncbi:MAG: hypothetical protein CMJ94_02130 [Planctomycetes bacterium]|nr:hypothetical protein [Planctomycetota bacterium]
MKCLAPALLLLLPACGNGAYGTEMVKDTPVARATMYHTDAVDAALADQVFQAMVDGAYNFASDLPEQVDRVNGRLTLRLCNDNEDTIATMLADPTDGAYNYFHGLAGHVSRAIGGEQVDIVLCRLKLDDPYVDIPWDPAKHGV